MPVAWVLSRGPSVVTAVCRRDLSLYTPPWRHRYMFYTQYLTWCFNQTRCDAMERERREVREARWMLERDWALQL